MIVPDDNFRDEELFKPMELFKEHGAEVKIASTTMEEINGMMGTSIFADMLLEDVSAEEYDCVIFVGGKGAIKYFKDDRAHRIAKQASYKILGAICVAPAILAEAGVLKDKKATCFGAMSTILERNGAKIVKQAVVEDGNIVTANGPSASDEFASMIKQKLES